MTFSVYLLSLEKFIKGWRDFKGITSRRDYWAAFSALILIGMIEHIFFFIAYMRQESEEWRVINNIYYYLMIGQVFIFIVPLTAMSVRRLRDVKRSVFWIFSVLCPLFLLILLSLSTPIFLQYHYAELCLIFLWLIGILWLIFFSVILLGWCGEKGADSEKEHETYFREVAESGETFDEILARAYFEPQEEALFEEIDNILTALESCCVEGFRRYNKEQPSEETHIWGALLAKAEMISLLLAEARTSDEPLLSVRFLNESERGLRSLARKARESDDEELYEELLHLVDNAQRELEKLLLRLSIKR